MYTISFVILHYLSGETTSACIDSILSTYQQSYTYKYNLIIVDNCSPDNSFQYLQCRYQHLDCITFLSAPSNLGFAKGNNLGYIYAIDKLHSDFIIITNNDTIFKQKDFLEILLTKYQTAPCALIGPDILNTGGYHQNPYRNAPVSDSSLKKWIRNRRLWLLYLKLEKLFRLSRWIPVFRRFYESKAVSGSTNWQDEKDGVVLQGACIIFTPQYIQHNPSYAFYPETYMYCEEDILAWLCRQQGLIIRYIPSLQVLHGESVSTELSTGDKLQKDLFLTENILKSLKIFKKLRSEKRV